MSDVQDLDETTEDAEISVPVVAADATDRAIEKHFETGRLRVVQDRNDFFLPHVVDFIEGRKWGNLRPEYQRRLRWDNHKKSKLIESFIMNVPVPPVFLYEKDIGVFEVMDGQQRLNTIVDFLLGRFELGGLKIWPSLNGRTFGGLPPLVRRGLERAKISAITLMSDTAMSLADNIDLRAQVFERLNTGGERLNPQELRNSLYSGSFNKLIVDIAASESFTMAWDIPLHSEHTLSDGSPSQKLRDNNLFKRMTDVEIVLRFFAFQDETKILGSVRSMLDNTMKNNRTVNEAQIEKLRSDFNDSLSLTISVFGNDAFRLPPSEGKPRGILSRPLFDAQMVALYRLRARAAEIIERRAAVKEEITRLGTVGSEQYDLIVGRANTAGAIKERIDAVQGAITGVL